MNREAVSEIGSGRSWGTTPAKWSAKETPRGHARTTLTIPAPRVSWASGTRQAALESKWRHRVRDDTPARSAISSIRVWSYPRASNSSSAAAATRRRSS